MHKKLVVIPTYNEKENIEAIIRKVFSYKQGFHILVVDDGSPDGTGQIVKTLQKEFSDALYILEREGKQGLGTAYLAGFTMALDMGYDYIFEMDADFSHPTEKLIELYEACANDGNDVAVGSRYTKGGGISNWPKNRLYLSYGASMYVRLITGMPIKDPTAGFMCYHRSVLEKLDFEKIEFIGYAFQIEMKYKSYCLGFKIAEVPIIFTDRILGTSKMNSSIIKEAVLGVLKLRFKTKCKR